MKLWYGYGSEHSMNLVMIGSFKEIADAVRVKQLIEWFTEKIQSDVEGGRMKVGEPRTHYSDEWLDLLTKWNVHSISPSELEQFSYDVRVETEDRRIVITTDENDVSAFLKLLLDGGAKVEVYSAHDYPETGYGRGTGTAKSEA